jgi:septal ring factor EnvC (AmiA/AmiB activator)
MTGIPTLISIVALSVTLVGAIFGFASLWGAMREKQRTQDEKQKDVAAALACTDARVTALETMMARMDESLKSVKENLESSNAKLDRLLDRQAAGRDV